VFNAHITYICAYGDSQRTWVEKAHDSYCHSPSPRLHYVTIIFFWAVLAVITNICSLPALNRSVHSLAKVYKYSQISEEKSRILINI
jgi:hypothetical protein